MTKAKCEQLEARYPKGENVRATYYDKNGNPLFLSTTKPTTGYFFLYEFAGDGLVRLGKGQSPIKLEEEFNVKKRMGVG